MQESHSLRELSAQPSWCREALTHAWRGLISSRKADVAKQPGVIVLDETGLMVTGPVSSVSISREQGELLCFFLHQRGVEFTPETILSRVWGAYRVHEGQFLDQTVGGLNDALRRAGIKGDAIERISDIGYRLRDEGE